MTVRSRVHRTVGRAIAFVVIGIACTSPITAQAQEAGSSSANAAMDKINSTKITLEANGVKTGDALHTIMKASGASYVLDEDLGQGTVTAHLKDVPFKDVLVTIVKVSTVPITYELQEGIFHFKKKPEAPAPPPPAEPAPQAKAEPKVEKVAVKNASAEATVRKLKGQYTQDQAVLPQTTITKPDAHGTISSFGFTNGVLTSSSVKLGPNGSVSRTGAPPINVVNLLKSLFGGHH